MKKMNVWLPTESEVRDFGLLKEMMSKLQIEFKSLSNKKPNEQVNLLKVKMVNRVLEPLQKLLKHEDAFKFLDLLEEEKLPTNSDVILIFSQYEAAAHDFNENHYMKDKYQSNEFDTVWRWMTKEFPPDYYSKK